MTDHHIRGGMKTIGRAETATTETEEKGEEQTKDNRPDPRKRT